MAEQLLEGFLVNLGFKADTVELDGVIEKLQLLNALADSLERLKALGVSVQVTMDARGDGGTVFGPN